MDPPVLLKEALKRKDLVEASNYLVAIHTLKFGKSVKCPIPLNEAAEYSDMVDTALKNIHSGNRGKTVGGVEDYTLGLAIISLIELIGNQALLTQHLVSSFGKLLSPPSPSPAEFYEHIHEALFEKLFWEVWAARKNDEKTLKALWNIFIGFKLPEGNLLCHYLIQNKKYDVIPFIFDCLRSDPGCYNNAMVILKRFCTVSTKPICEQIANVWDSIKLLLNQQNPSMKIFVLLGILRTTVPERVKDRFIQEKLGDFCLRSASTFPVSTNEMTELANWVRMTTFILASYPNPEALIRSFKASHLPYHGVPIPKESQAAYDSLSFFICEYISTVFTHFPQLLSILIHDLNWDLFILESVRRSRGKTDSPSQDLHYKSRIEIFRIFCSDERFLRKVCMETSDIIPAFLEFLFDAMQPESIPRPIESVHLWSVIAAIIKQPEGQNQLRIMPELCNMMSEAFELLIPHAEPSVCSVKMANNISMYEAMLSVISACGNMLSVEEYREELSNIGVDEHLRDFIVSFFGETGTEGLENEELVLFVLQCLANFAKQEDSKSFLCKCAMSNLLSQTLQNELFVAESGKAIKQMSCIAIINLAAQHDTDANKTELANHACIPSLVDLLENTRAKVPVEDVFWALANLFANTNEDNQERFIASGERYVKKITKAFSAYKMQFDVAYRGCQLVANVCRNNDSILKLFKKNQDAKNVILTCANNPMKTIVKEMLSI
jgi:hypothetical protein